MDFVEGLLNSKGKTTIFVVVDRLSKFDHFILFNHPYIMVSIAHIFFDNIFKLYGMPTSIVYDRDPVFTSTSGESYFNCRDLNSILV